MRRRELSTIILASAAGAVLLPRSAQSQSCPPPCYARTAAEESAGVTPTGYEYVPGDIRRYGAVGDAATECATAIQSAINQALKQPGGAPVLIPSGQFKVSTTLTVSSASHLGRFAMAGTGPLSQIINNITGSPASPCILVQDKGAFYLFQNFQINGNGLSGARGNGHGIAFINPDRVGIAGITTFYPQFVTLENVVVQAHLGYGKDYSGASIPACAVYQYGITVHKHMGCGYSNNTVGLRMLLSEKVHLSECIIDGQAATNGVANNGLYIDSCQAVEFLNGTINDCGIGGATDGHVYVTGTRQQTHGVTVCSSRMKSGNPYIVNLSGSVNCASRAIEITDNDIRQIRPGPTTAISVGNGNHGVKIDGNYLLFGNTFKNAVGVDVGQVTSGYSCGGLEIQDNVFDGGIGCTYAAGIRLNIGTDYCRSPIIRANVFGDHSNGFNFTDGIRLTGHVDHARIENNYFIPGPGGVITNAINIANGKSIRWTVIEGNTYDTAKGTITNQITGYGLNVYRNEGGIFAPGDALSQAAIADRGTITTAGQPLVRVAPGTNVAGIIMQAGLFRGQYCAVENNSSFTIAFADSGTSNVADGTRDVIAALTMRLFIWDANLNLWFRCS
jgi:hypothetical protein